MRERILMVLGLLLVGAAAYVSGVRGNAHDVFTVSGFGMALIGLTMYRAIGHENVAIAAMLGAGFAGIMCFAQGVLGLAGIPPNDPVVVSGRFVAVLCAGALMYLVSVYLDRRRYEASAATLRRFT